MHWTMFCPKCESTDMKFEDLAPEEEVIIQVWNCNKCKAHGVDSFTLSGRKVWDEEDKSYDRIF